MSLSANENTRLTDMLMALKAEMGHDNSCIRGRAVEFVNDQIRRHNEYGPEMFISSKQWKWLEDLYAETTGEARDDGGLEPVDEHIQNRGRDLDDEIPF